MKILGTGQLLRKFAREKNKGAQKIKKELERGNLMPSWLVFFLWLRELLRVPQERGIILDGSPRRREEAEFLDEVLAWLSRSPLTVLCIDISKREAIARLAKRKRFDDTPAAIRARLAAFEKEARPVIAHYRRRGQLITINGAHVKKRVFQEILQKIQSHQ